LLIAIILNVNVLYPKFMVKTKRPPNWQPFLIKL
jgi:hypothetical protein